MLISRLGVAAWHKVGAAAWPAHGAIHILAGGCGVAGDRVPPCAALDLQIVSSTGSAWRVAVLGGAAAVVLTALVLRIFPGPGGPPPVTGTLLADLGNGQVVAADATGADAPATVILQARPRAATSIRRFYSVAKLVSAQQPWWDLSARAFVANTSLVGTDESNGRLPVDAAISFYSAEGQQESTITSSSAQWFGYLSISPDGDWIAYEVYKPTSQTQRTHIIVAPVDRCCHALETLGGFGRPAWSPDSTRLAYQCSPDGGSPQLCIYDVVTGRQQVISTPGFQDIQDPAWSPDNQSVAVTAVFGEGEHEQVVAVDTATGTATPLTSNAQYKAFPQWSPSGGQVAFVGAGGIWMVNVQDKQEQLFLKGSYTDIQWIPDDMTGFGAG
jgi:hypothetical protein